MVFSHKKTASHGRIKETTIGGFVMQRKYRHIKSFEKELIEYIEQGHTLRETVEKYGFTHKEMKDFKTRYNKNQRKLSAGIAIKPKGRPRKDGTELPPSIQQLRTLTQLQYELASKDRHIKRLEMENELMRDFLSLTERKRGQA